MRMALDCIEPGEGVVKSLRPDVSRTARLLVFLYPRKIKFN